jgi:single-strand DNA-binding protein
MNDIQVTLRGNVASDPRQVRFDDGNTLTSFRLASNPRYFDRDRREWVDRETTYVTVICRRAMAANTAASVRKGHPMVVTGTLRERSWSSSNGRSGQTLEIEAATLGHDLSYGTSEFVRIVRAVRVEKVKDLDGDKTAYLIAQHADDKATDRRIADVSGLTVLDDPDESDRVHDPDDDPDDADELISMLPESAVA